MTGAACVRCVMDESDPDLALDANGVCRYCRRYDERASAVSTAPRSPGQTLDRLVAQMKAEGKRRPYDCIIGLSGGVDSSYAVLVAKRLGLRPLAVHVDNGWNSELAVMNIESVVRGTGVDLYTHVIDWPQFRDLQLSLLRASVVDLELPSDHAIIAGMMLTARKFGVRWVVSGDNAATETTLPPTWNHRKTDLRNLKAIHRTFSQSSLSTFPQMSTLEYVAYQRILRMQYVPLLSYVPYVKEEAIAEMAREFGWRAYGGKHHESIITRFYQGYILPRKFGIDKRKLHLSMLVLSGQMTRAEALAELKVPHYDPKLIELDREYVIKKFGITEAEFERIMKERPVPHRDFGSDQFLLDGFAAVKRVVSRRGRAHFG